MPGTGICKIPHIPEKQNKIEKGKSGKNVR